MNASSDDPKDSSQGFGPDPALASGALAGLEAAINKTLNYDPGSRKRLEGLGERTLRIRCTAPRVQIYIVVQYGEIKLQQHTESKVDTELTGSLPALTALGIKGGHSLADSGVTVIGSTGLLIELQAIASDLDIDWEEPISQLLGDLAGPKIASVLRTGFRWLGAQAQGLSQRSGEFFSEELGSTPSASELERYYRDIDQLRDDSERLDAKFRRLEQTIADRQN